MKHLLKIIFIAAIVLIFINILVALPVFAAEPIKFVPLAPLPGQTSEEVNLGGYFVSMYKFIIGAAGVLAVLMIVIAGVEYMSPMPSSKESGKNRALAAIFGLLLALVSYLILNTINPDLVNFKLDIPKTGITPPGGGNPNAVCLAIPTNKYCNDVLPGSINVEPTKCGAGGCGFGQTCCEKS